MDPFQVTACNIVAEGDGVLVCAPTGAGKTIVGEFAVYQALQHGAKCFYTTPIKALSNQKYHDLVAVYGEDSVGLLTGDVSINGDADIVVMTTEVLRNMIYASSPALNRLESVVMDEIHFLADKSRGAVWEEVILNLDDSVAVIGLSATVSNSEEFGRWLSTVRGHTQVVVTDHRPIPLEQWMIVKGQLYPLFDQLDNPLIRASDSTADKDPDKRSLSRPLSIDDMARAHNQAAQAASESDATLDPQHSAPQLNPRLDKAVRRAERSAEGGDRGFRGGSGGGRAYAASIKRTDVIEMLDSHSMLPVIFFIFSRSGCDKALIQCSRSRLTLTTQQESQQIAAIIDAGVEGIPDEDLKVLGFRQWRSNLMRGFAAHHAGMLPAFRHIVEELFVKGLVKAVFATETLALGINMPARTVLIERLVKYNGEGFVDVTPGQYTQLTGRAGRRGIDTIGHAVVQWEPGLDPVAVASLASTRTYPLDSTFSPGYNMTVNLLATIGYTRGRSLIERSFAQFQLDGDVVSHARDEARLATKVQQLKKQLDTALDEINQDSSAPVAPISVNDLAEYLQLRQELSMIEKADKKRALSERGKETKALLKRARVGDVIALPGKKSPIIACVMEPAFGGSSTITITTEQGWCGRISAEDLAIPPLFLGDLRVPSFVARNPRKHAGKTAQLLRGLDIKRPRRLKNTVKVRPSARAVETRNAMREHPAHNHPHTDALAAKTRDYQRAVGQLEALRREMDSAQNSLGRTFDDIVDLLEHLGYIEKVTIADAQQRAEQQAALSGTTAETITADHDEDQWVYLPTDEGERLARIHNSSDLLIAQCLRRGIFNDLDPAELAAAVSQCTYEARKEVSYDIEQCAATENLAQAMRRTHDIWRELIWEENSRHLDPTTAPDPGFALAIHQWTAGAPLGYALAAANQMGAQMTPGDFVRQCRQVVDALDQVSDTGYTDEIRRSARQAREAIRRGVVALGM
ncbi:DEAD/DEAH box helicase [Corynebacterium aquilae]|nr:DEAD/DEAH box helicase [Corynebacterium aquilae]